MAKITNSSVDMKIALSQSFKFLGTQCLKVKEVGISMYFFSK